MTNRDIYIAALVKLNEPIGEGLSEDYRERVPYMLADFWRLAEDPDKKYRAAYGIPKRGAETNTYFELDEEFPLPDVFISPAVAYVASELVQYDDESFSEDLRDQWSCMMAEIEMELPASIEQIVERYPQ